MSLAHVLLGLATYTPGMHERLVESRVHIVSVSRRNKPANPLKTVSNNGLTTSGVYLLAAPQTATSE